MRSEMPNLVQLRELPRLLAYKIPPNWEDLNGHVNVQFYTTIYDLAGYPLMEMMGIDTEFSANKRTGFFDLEHHIWFLNEMHVGDQISAYACLIGRSVKRIHGVLFIVDDTRECLASALEFLCTAADLEKRRTAAVPKDVAQRVDTLIAEQCARSWVVPQCGSMNL